MHKMISYIHWRLKSIWSLLQKTYSWFGIKQASSQISTPLPRVYVMSCCYTYRGPGFASKLHSGGQNRIVCSCPLKSKKASVSYLYLLLMTNFSSAHWSAIRFSSLSVTPHSCRLRASLKVGLFKAYNAPPSNASPISWGLGHSVGEATVRRQEAQVEPLSVG